MAERAPYPDVEACLVELLADLAATGTVVPSDLQSAVPFIRIKRTGGPNDLVSDSPSVTIDSFVLNEAGGRSNAYDLAETIRQRLLDVPHRTSVGLIDFVSTTSGPAEIPWGSEVWRYSASYSISSRR